MNSHLVEALWKINANVNEAWKCVGSDGYTV